MDMSSACPICAAKPVRGPHGGWKPQEIDVLEKSVGEASASGESLRSVFERVGEQLGRKPNSIRNFYYAQLRGQDGEQPPRALPFETFAPEEVERLIEQVLTARAQGMSVRACVRRLAGGDKTLMLRYQNKYRSTVRSRPELVSRIMQRLEAQGVPFVSPYAQDDAPSALPRVRQRAQALEDPQLEPLFCGLDRLITLALERRSPHDAPDGDAQRRADSLSARNDVLRIALADEHARFARLCAEAEGVVSLMKEYIALPEEDRGEQTALFCQQAASRLCAMEAAMMAPPEGI